MSISSTESREKNELGEQAFYESLLGKGPADPDMVGYPGEDLSE